MVEKVLLQGTMVKKQRERWRQGSARFHHVIQHGTPAHEMALPLLLVLFIPQLIHSLLAQRWFYRSCPVSNEYHHTNVWTCPWVKTTQWHWKYIQTGKHGYCPPEADSVYSHFTLRCVRVYISFFIALSWNVYTLVPPFFWKQNYTVLLYSLVLCSKYCFYTGRLNVAFPCCLLCP